jgi:hypothetical protein
MKSFVIRRGVLWTDARGDSEIEFVAQMLAGGWKVQRYLIAERERHSSTAVKPRCVLRLRVD